MIFMFDAARELAAELIVSFQAKQSSIAN